MPGSETISSSLVVRFVESQNLIDSELRSLSGGLLPSAAKGGRVNAANRRIDRSISLAREASDKFYSEGLTEIYRAGYSQRKADITSVFGVRWMEETESIRKEQGLTDAMSPTDRSWLSRRRKAGREATEFALEQTRTKARAATSKAAKGRDYPRNVAGQLVTVPSKKSQHSLANYGSMVTNAQATQAYNRGSLAAMRDARIKYVKCIDGIGCGWTSHTDPETANGKIVTIEEALAQSTAHPYCQRQFIPAGKGDEPPNKGQRAKLNKLAKAVAVTAGVGAVAAGGVLVYDNRIAILAAINRQLLKGLPEFDQFYTRLRATQMNLERAIASGADELIDIRTGKPLTTSVEDIAERVMIDARNFRNGVDMGMADQTRAILGVRPRDTIDDIYKKIDSYSGFMHAHRGSQGDRMMFTAFNKVDDDLRERVVGELIEPTHLFDRVGSSAARIPITRRGKMNILKGPANRVVEQAEKLLPDNNVVRMSLPEIQGQGRSFGLLRAVRGRLDIGQSARLIGTQKINNVPVGSLLVNRNGLLRMGFQYGADRRIYPRISLITRSPLRISTRINRSAAEETAGYINSLSGTIKLVLPGPFNPSANFNIDLRSLQMKSLWDIREIRFRQLKTLTADNFRVRSLALEGRMRLAHKLEFQQTLRMQYDDVAELFRKTNDDVFMDPDVFQNTLARRFRVWEMRYFGDFKTDARNGFKRFRTISSGQIKEYFGHKFDVIQDYAVNGATYAEELIRKEFSRQKEALIREYNQVIETAHSLRHYIKNFDRDVAKGYLETIRQSGANVAYETRKTASIIKRDTIEAIHQLHQKLFHDMPADKRRKMLKVLHPADDITFTSWQERLWAYGSDPIEVANRYDLTVDEAIRLITRAKEDLAGVLDKLDVAIENLDPDELATLIANAPVNKKKGMNNVVSFRDYFGRPNAIEATGDFFDNLHDYQLNDLLDQDTLNAFAAQRRSRAADGLDWRTYVPDARDRDAIYDAVGDLDNGLPRSWFFPDFDDVGKNLSAADKADLQEDILKVVKMFNEKFPSPFKTEISVGDLPDGVFAFHDPTRRLVTLRPELFDADPDLIAVVREVSDLGHFARIEHGEEFIHLLTHEMVHSLDFTRGIAYKRSDEVEELIRKYFPDGMAGVDLDLSDDFTGVTDINELLGIYTDQIRELGVSVGTHGRTAEQAISSVRLDLILQMNGDYFPGMTSDYGFTNTAEFLAETGAGWLSSRTPSDFGRDLMSLFTRDPDWSLIEHQRRYAVSEGLSLRGRDEQELRNWKNWIRKYREAMRS